MWLALGAIAGLLTSRQAFLSIAAGLLFLAGAWATFSGAFAEGSRGLWTAATSGPGQLVGGFAAGYVLRALLPRGWRR